MIKPRDEQVQIQYAEPTVSISMRIHSYCEHLQTFFLKYNKMNILFEKSCTWQLQISSKKEIDNAS